MNHAKGKEQEVVNVLLIEDNPGDVDLIRDVVESGQYPVRLTVVENCNEALDCLRRRGRHAEAPTPKLILMDLNTPQKSTHDLIVEIKWDDHLKRIPVVIISSSTNADEINICYDNLANCYVGKAFVLSDFRYKMQSLLTFWLFVAELPHSGD